MINIEYIHYGHAEFNPDKFKTIANEPYFCKPRGGLWGSPVITERGWKDWYETEQFRDCDEDDSFKFKLKENAKMYTINCMDDCVGIPQAQHISGKTIKIDPNAEYHQSIYPDFEELVKQGYDAIAYNLSGDSKLYWVLYGWDCDSILVLNKNVVEVINTLRN